MFLKLPHCSHLFVDKANMFQEKFKIKNYEEVNPSILNKLIIFSIEATGRIGPQAHKFLENILPKPKSGIPTYKQMLKEFECIITKQNAIMSKNIIAIDNTPNIPIINHTYSI